MAVPLRSAGAILDTSDGIDASRKLKPPKNSTSIANSAQKLPNQPMPNSDSSTSVMPSRNIGFILAFFSALMIIGNISAIEITNTGR